MLGPITVLASAPRKPAPVAPLDPERVAESVIVLARALDAALLRITALEARLK